jgi:hypothetical protein
MLPPESNHQPEANPYEPPLAAELLTDVDAGGFEQPKPTDIPRPQPHLGWSLLLVFLAMAVQMFVGLFAAVLFVIVAAILGGNLQELDELGDELTSVLIPAATGTMLLTAVAIAWVMMRNQLGRKLALRGCTPWQWLLVLLLLVPQSVLANELANVVMDVVRAINHPLLDVWNDMSWVEGLAQQNWLLVLVGACVFPALGEEILFRGVLSRGLVAHHGVLAGSIFASVLFGLMHVAPAHALATIVIGMVLQLVFLTTRSLWAPIVLHFLNNAMAFTVVHFGEQIPIPGFTVDSANHIPPLVVVTALLATIALLGLLYQSRTRWLLPDGTEWSPGFFATEAPPAELEAQPICRAPTMAVAAAGLIAIFAFGAACYFSLSLTV